LGYAVGCIEGIGEPVTLAANGTTHESAHIIEYIATTAPQDLYNSKGVRLHTVGPICLKPVPRLAAETFPTGSK